MKSILLFAILLTFVLSASAQTTDKQQQTDSVKLRVAVFDPTISGTMFDAATGAIVRELVSTALVNTGKYLIIERSLIDKILKEQKFSNSGAVDESQASELGKLAGANKVILSVLSSYGDRGMLSLKMIDVESASIESQKSKIVSANDILDIITTLTYETIGVNASDMQLADNETKSTNKGNQSVLGGASSVFSNGKTPSKSNNTVSDANVSLTFSGTKNGKNPESKIYLDDKLLGTGTMNEGFSLNFEDCDPGEHQLRIDWSSVIPSKTFKINTNKKQEYIFDYIRSGFGYEFKIIN